MRMKTLMLSFVVLLLASPLVRAADTGLGQLRKGDCMAPEPGVDLRHCDFSGRRMDGIAFAMPA